MKVILISIDGMRPDGLLQCGNPFVDVLLKESSYCLSGKAVYPSVTLPCHMSMFHSVPPERHGITTNLYTPQVRPVSGLFEQLHNAGKVSAMFYGWEELRDIGRPGSLSWASYINCFSEEHTDGILTDRALECIDKHHPDFVFLYMVETDDKGGHGVGWMSETYLEYIRIAIENVKRVYEAVREEYTIIITADHGGHGRGHGEDVPEDMTIPMLCLGKPFAPGKRIPETGLLDIAPTIATLTGVPIPREWEGKSLV